MADGGQVEAATVGNEGMVGLPLFLGGETSTNDALAQVAGEAMCMSAAVLREEVQRSAAFTNLLCLYAQGYLTQVSQSSACNRLHPIDQRLCRWVLMTHDRVGLDTLPLTQEFLAAMLGVRRASVSTAAAILQKAGFIDYERGVVRVLDREGLERGSCECYAVVRAELERLLCEPK
jgi:CRP-like cAMP-binding protein